MNGSDDVRKQVAERYTQAVQATRGSLDQSVGQLAGYSVDALQGVPADAATSSFGCGNPVAFADLKPGDVVLDLGSGAGIDLILAAKRVGPTGKVIGVDMTDAMIERARANIAAAGLTNVEVRKGLIEELPVESSSVDWVISNCVINLSPEKAKVFAEMARVLRPGGRVRVSDIMVTGLPDWARESAALYASCVGGAISEADYLEGMRQAGLVDAEVPERLVYEASQLLAFAEADPGLATAASCGCGTSLLTPEVAKAFEGKVWSARVHARKAAAS